MSDTPPIIVHRRGEDHAEALLFGCFWDHNGMLQIRQNQKHSKYRIGSDEEPALVLYAEQLPALMADLKEAASMGAQHVAEGIQHNQRVLADLRALTDEPSPLVTPEKPAKKKGATRHE
ncbi:MAG: hypothetical protein ACOYOF_11590 [Verrucomicrobiaceae bacterium]